MPLSTTTIVGPWTYPTSAGLAHRGTFTITYQTSDGTIRYPAEDKTMSGTVSYDVPANGVMAWSGLVSFPQTGLLPDTNLRAVIRFDPKDKGEESKTWVIDTLPAGNVSLDDLTDVAGVPISLGYLEQVLDARDEAVMIAGLTNTDSAFAGYVGLGGSLTKAAVDARVGAGITGKVDKGSLVFNAKDYGVTGNGTTDDTTNFQSALTAAAGATLHVPAGTYRLGTVNVPAGTILQGVGNTTVLKAKNSLDADLITNTSGASDITIRNLAIDGNRANQTDNVSARGIYLVNCARLLIDGLHVYEVEGHAIHLSNSGTVEGQRVSNCVIRNIGSGSLNTMGSGLATSSAAGLTITNVQVYDTSKAGFRLSGHSITLNGCVAKRNANGGVVPVSGDNFGLTINGGHFNDNGTWNGSSWGNADGIRLVGAKDVTINGVECTGNQGAGLGIYNSTTDVTITGGIFKNNGKFGGTPATTEGRDGITINGDTTAVTGVTIGGVRCYDDQGVKTQQYGIRLRNLADFITINPSDLRGNGSGSYRNDSSTATSVILGKCQGVELFTVDNTSGTVTGTLTETDLRTVTIPAGQLGRRSGIRMRAAGTIAGTAGTKAIRFKLGGTTAIAVSAVAGSTSNWVVEVEVYNTTSGAQNVVIQGFEGLVTDAMSWSSFAIDTTAAVSVGLTATLGNTADSVVCRSFSIEPI